MSGTLNYDEEDLTRRISKLKQRHEATRQELQRLEDDMAHKELKHEHTYPSDGSEYDFSEQSVMSSSTPDVNRFCTSTKFYKDGLRLPRGRNKSFTEFETREIERQNALLIKRIANHNRKPSQYRLNTGYYAKVSNSQVNRKKKQEQIDRENMILLKKIQSAKPFGLSMRK